MNFPVPEILTRFLALEWVLHFIFSNLGIGKLFFRVEQNGGCSPPRLSFRRADTVGEGVREFFILSIAWVS